MIRQRIAELIMHGFGRHVQPQDPNAEPMTLTDRGYRYVAERLKREVNRINEEAPVQMMVQSAGWKIVEGEIAQEILDLWLSALDKMASADPVQREEAKWDAMIAKTLNERVLRRVSGKMLDAVLLRNEMMAFENVKEEYLKLTERQ